jgi:hypothetical protein
LSTENISFGGKVARRRWKIDFAGVLMLRHLIFSGMYSPGRRSRRKRRSLFRRESCTAKMEEMACRCVDIFMSFDFFH